MRGCQVQNDLFVLVLLLTWMNYIPAAAVCLLPSGFATAHEMYNLYLVIIAQNCRGPLHSANDLVIKFNCDLFGFQFQTLSKFREGQTVRHFVRLAIDLNAQQDL